MVADYHVYCAACSCTLGADCELGSASPAALKYRREYVARRVYWRGKGGTIYCETDDEEDEEREERLRGMNAQDECYTSSLPTSVPDEIERSSHFIAEISYDDRNLVTVLNPDDDINIPEEAEFFCYYTNSDKPVVFPMHLDCLQLLCRAITGCTDIEALDKKALYDTMHELTEFSTLKLPYGDIKGPDQDWHCIPGEEYTVTCPNQLPELPSPLSKQFPLSPRNALPNLSSKVLSDPFRKLALEITDIILSYVPGGSLKAILNTSWVLNDRTRHERFWKQRIRHDMPWFWELHGMLEDPENEDVDFKKFYFYLERETRPAYGMTSDFRGIANRRRIWEACERLVQRYHEIQREAQKRPLMLNN
ncbi:F-box domain protein [Aspergillus terreus]|uniref:F-box domain protein n=1 Tax=Aspergillus terreus TaxID=33178 RepID=A0A5M3YPI6_ASPTE|nr:hypothetical protein ATETN484_0002048100 [Aspergillus terreus]GFF15337.1 F-box domain protein [Aspergillus terreus]